ncbi:MAG TPA: hypothetical protein VGS11_07335 [Candidatus Bathyarchaeia archaeon]|nr:hypothetical protein [Candidatus Bathyarchaeia archaeon]
MGAYRSLASFGKRQEYAAISELLKRSYHVYQILIDDQGIDCVIRKIVNGRPAYVDLQIKARSKDCIPIDAGRIAAFEIKEPRENFLFMFHSEQTGSYWITPSLELVRLASRNKTGKNAGKYHVLLTGIQSGKAITNPRFDLFRDENGYGKLEEAFVVINLSSVHYQPPV